MSNRRIEELGTGVRAAVEYAAEVHGNTSTKKKNRVVDKIHSIV